MKNFSAPMRRMLEGLLSVIFPETCPCCGRALVRGERLMCLNCRISLPLTNFHVSPTNNELRDKLNGLVPIEKAVAYFYYDRLSPHAQLIHDAKYRERPLLARRLAAEYARTLLSVGFFNNIDAIAPVPLNFWKECRRGYNQSACIGEGLAEVAGLPLLSVLRARRHKSQTRKSAADRRQGIKGVFSPVANACAGINHLLLVDDISTTGATLYECAQTLHNSCPNLQISVCVLASTRRL